MHELHKVLEVWSWVSAMYAKIGFVCVLSELILAANGMAQPGVAEPYDIIDLHIEEGFV